VPPYSSSLSLRQAVKMASAAPKPPPYPPILGGKPCSPRIGGRGAAKLRDSTLTIFIGFSNTILWSLCYIKRDNG
jgi:hypothetical protein